jgi:multicomponent Na+:H+ antiporter subunit A
MLVWGLSQYSLPWQFALPWVPSLDINLAFRIDGLSAQMLALITGIGTLVFIYAVGYLDHEPKRARIFLVLPLFMLAMIGAVSADDVVVLFLFWEMTSITSFLLVGFKHTQEAARESARQALLITMGGGLALLGGLLLLAQIADTRLLSEIIIALPELRDDPRLPYAVMLVLLGAFTKSAQFPFHFWLPNAMSAPTPVSAYLHSATMVKLGIYLMARLDPAFNDWFLWEITLISVGTTTALWAAVLALRERDLKRILARSTVSALGTLTLLIGLPSPGAGLAVVTFLFAHAIYKAPLFMIAGNIDHATGTRVIDHLMGLRRVMPWSAAAAILAGLSMAGLPLAFGFVAKDTISMAKEQADMILVVSYILVLVNAVAAAVAGVAAIRVFWGPLETPYKHVHEEPWLTLLPPLLIAFIGVEFEFFPHIADTLLLNAAQSISPGLNVTELSASYELGKMLSATGITLAIGILLFLTWDRLHDALSRIHWLDSIGPEATYHALLKLLPRIAAWHTRLLQGGRLDIYLPVSLAALLLMLVFAALQTTPRFAIDSNWPAHAWAWAMAAIIMVAGAMAAARLQDRLAALMASGLVGYGAALLFLFAGAPDLAFTQFSMETALVVIAAAVLPRFAVAPRVESSAVVKFVLAAAAGIGTLALLLHLNGFSENRVIADWFAAHSLPEAYGRNVVNVIIVDFRALDTLGEIAVVAFALLAALPLLNSAKPASTTPTASPMLNLAAMPLYWLMLAASLWILLRGHNAPGGGFIGGLIAVAASSLLATLRSPAVALRFQPLAPLTLSLVGLVLALIGGLIGLFFGDGFLRHVWAGGLSSVMIFDLGVFCVVWGVLTGYVYGLLDTRQVPDSA